MMMAMMMMMMMIRQYCDYLVSRGIKTEKQASDMVR